MGTSPEDLIQRALSTWTTAEHTPDKDQRFDHLADMDSLNQLAVSQLLVQIRDLLRPPVALPAPATAVDPTPPAILHTTDGNVDVTHLVAKAWQEGFEAAWNHLIHHVEEYVLENVPTNPYKRD